MSVTLDLSVLRLLTDRAKFDRFHTAIPAGTVTKETGALIKRFKEFYATTDASRITFDEFWPFLRSHYPRWKDSDAAHWRALVEPIDKPNPAGYEETIIRNLLAADLGNKALLLIETWGQGGEVELGEGLKLLTEDYESALDRKVKTPRVAVDMGALIEAEQDDAGLHWRLDCLNTSTRPLRSGDFGIIAARPDRGKTSFVASEITHMAPQVHRMYEGKRPIVWLNNEGPGERIQNRVVQAALGLKVTDIIALGKDELLRQYAEVVGHVDMIQTYNIHGFQTYEVADLLRKLNPAVVVYDMIDNIRFAGATMHGGERTDQLLESMYQWAREQGVIHDFIGLATSQISDQGEGEKWPAQNLLKDSRTGKQGACDFIITVGSHPNYDRTRFIGMSKNKIVRQGGAYSPRCEVNFNRDTSRFEMPLEADPEQVQAAKAEEDISDVKF